MIDAAPRPLFRNREEDLERRNEAALSRDEEFAALVHRQSKFVFQVAQALLRNGADAEDTVQEVFLRLHRNGSWRTAENERAFLARVAWRVALTRLRKRRSEGCFPDVRGAAVRNPEKVAMEGDQVGWIHRIIDSLPDELRQPLALSAIEEMNSREIAAVMGIAEGTVRTRLMRARQIVKEKWQACQGGDRGQ